MGDRELVRQTTPYKFTLDGSTRQKGVTTDFSHENYKGMDFFDFDFLGLSDTSDDYIWVGLNYEVTLDATPNAVDFIGSGLDDATSAAVGGSNPTENCDVVIKVFDDSLATETYVVSVDNGATYYGDDDAMYISSSSGSDTTQTITVVGLDENLVSQSVVASLAGQTKTRVGSTELFKQVTSITSDTVCVGKLYLYYDDTVTGGIPDSDDDGASPSDPASTRLTVGIDQLRASGNVSSSGIDMSVSATVIEGCNTATIAFAAVVGHTEGDMWLVSTLGTAHYGEDILKSWEVA